MYLGDIQEKDEEDMRKLWQEWKTADKGAVNEENGESFPQILGGAMPEATVSFAKVFTHHGAWSAMGLPWSKQG